MRCAVPNCRNASIRRSKRDPDQQLPVSFFQFPKSPDLFNRWLSFCSGSENALKVKNPCICIEHFRDEDIEGSIKFEMGLAKKRTLRPGAVPCINKSQESPSEKARLERTKRRSNHKLVAELLLEDEVRSNASAEVVPTPNYVRLNTGIASAPPFVSSRPAEDDSIPSIVVEDDPLVAAEKAETRDKCRICYKDFIVDDNAKYLFDPENSVLIFHIEVISGVWIQNIEDEPQLICPACQLSLQMAIEFREMCIGVELKLTQPKAEIDEEPDVESVQEETLELDIHSGSEYSNFDECCSPEESVVNESLPLESMIESPELVSPDPLSVAPGATIVKDLISQYTGMSATKTRREATIAKVVTKPKPNQTSVDCEENTKRYANRRTKEERNCMRRAQIRARPTNFVCDQCGQAFRMAHNLQIHILRHTRTKNYQCTECPMTFYDAYMRNIHIRIKHRGETPFSCRFCKATFAYAGARQKHESGVHGAQPRRIVNRINTQPMPRTKTRHHCELCDKHYASKYALAWHVKSHTDAGAYKCRLCDKSYSDPARLKRHEISHDDKRPLQCGVCLKGFYQQTKLREHELIHTGERPYRCEICDVHFRYKYNMKVHANSKMHQENLSKAQSNQIVEIE